MQKKFTTIKKSLIVISCIFGGLASVFALTLPGEWNKPDEYFTDFTKTIPSDKNAIIKADLAKYEKETNNEIAVVVIDNIPENISLENLAVDFVEQWGIGKTASDNGVLLLIAKDDRKMRIEVGYGLTPFLTGIEADSIIRNDIAPFFKNSDYVGGIQSGITAIKTAIKDAHYEEQSNNQAGGTSLWVIILIMILFFGNILVYLISLFIWNISKSHSWYMGGLLCALLLTIVGFIIGLGFIALLVYVFAGLGLGLFSDNFLSKRFADVAYKDLPDWMKKIHGIVHRDNSNDSGNGIFFFGGGNSNGGGSSWGGFGGGMSGGGGASGDW